MTSPDLVSIITPALNAKATIQDTYASLASQTHEAWEWLIVDDGSTDGTLEWLRECAASDSRVNPLTHTNPPSIAAARQTALDHAKGRWVAFIDADDIWLPEKLARQIAFMKEKGAAFSFTAFRRFRDDGTAGAVFNTALLGRLIPVPPKLGYWSFAANTAIATSSAMLDMTKVETLSVPQVLCEDYATWLGLLRRGFVAQGLNEDLLRYRVRTVSSSSNKWENIKRVWHILRKVEGLSLLPALYCTASYIARGFLKHFSF
ncbi:MAG: glycosyltransferase family 2 protein [Bdellovibrionales bacterium]